MAHASEGIEVEEEVSEEKGTRKGEEKEVDGVEEEWTYPEGGLRAWGVVLVSLGRRRERKVRSLKPFGERRAASSSRARKWGMSRCCAFPN